MIAVENKTFRAVITDCFLSNYDFDEMELNEVILSSESNEICESSIDLEDYRKNFKSVDSLSEYTSTDSEFDKEKSKLPEELLYKVRNLKKVFKKIIMLPFYMLFIELLS